jgi:hypothetical protein
MISRTHWIFASLEWSFRRFLSEETWTSRLSRTASTFFIEHLLKFNQIKFWIIINEILFDYYLQFLLQHSNKLDVRYPNVSALLPTLKDQMNLSLNLSDTTCTKLFQ